MRLIGIDPGLSGAFAFVSESDIHIHDMPLDDKREVIGAAITEMLEAYVPHIIVLENVHGPNNFKFGKAFGALLVTLKSSRFRLERVSPRTWQTAMLGHVTNDKSESIALALTNHPDAPLVRPGHRKPDHNRADALNIADYGRITYAPA